MQAAWCGWLYHFTPVLAAFPQRPSRATSRIAMAKLRWLFFRRLCTTAAPSVTRTGSSGALVCLCLDLSTHREVRLYCLSRRRFHNFAPVKFPGTKRRVQLIERSVLIWRSRPINRYVRSSGCFCHFLSRLVSHRRGCNALTYYRRFITVYTGVLSTSLKYGCCTLHPLYF